MIKGAARYPLYGIGLTLEILLGIEAGASVAAIFVQPMILIAIIGFGLTIVIFLIWFYMARINAERLGAWMRRGRGWAIGAWFVPVIALWFPLQIMLDIWRANRPAEDRWRPGRLVGWWWACWLLAWFTSVHHDDVAVRRPNGGLDHVRLLTLSFEGTGLSKAMTAAAAVLLIVIVYFITSGPVGTSGEVARAAPSPGTPLAAPPADPEPTAPAHGT